MSGVLFEVKEDSPRRTAEGKELIFCCGACANYFSDNAHRVLTLRGMTN